MAQTTSSPDSHYAIYDRYKDQTARLPVTLLSAKNYNGTQIHAPVKDYHGSQPHVFVLFRWQDELRCLVYNLERKQIVEEDSAEGSRALLDLLQCDDTELKADVSAKEVERAAVEATQAWLAARQHQNEQQANEDDEESPLIRLCAVYLKPQGKRETALSDIITGPAFP